MPAAVLSAEPWRGGVREPLWPEGRIPDFQTHQSCGMVDEPAVDGKRPTRSPMPYLEWFAPPADPNGGCMILIPGGAYEYCGGIDRFRLWRDRFTELGYQTVALVYRAPRPKGGLPCHQSAWEDGQRAVRLVRSQARVRGYDPERIGAIGMSAGGHLVTMLATSALTDAYQRVDALDDLPCHLNWGIANAPAYNTANSAAGIPYHIDGTINEWPKASPFFKFDAKTCPVSFHHGAVDGYTPNGSTQCYRELRKRKIPAELHLYADCGHDAIGLERAVEFMRQMNFDGRLGVEKALDHRFFPGDTIHTEKEYLWPEGKTPDDEPRQIADRRVGFFGLTEQSTKRGAIPFGNYRGTASALTYSSADCMDSNVWAGTDAEGAAELAFTLAVGEKLMLTLDSAAAWDANQLSGEFTTAAIAATKKTAVVPSRTYAVSAQRNAFGKTWYFAATGDETTGWKLAYTEDTKGAALTVTLKADGSTSIAGKLPNGTDTKGKAVTIKVSASGYANVGGLKDGAILADFASVLTVNKVKTALAIKINLWFDRKNDHESGVGEARFVK